ncbi:hypothetical protein [Streptomyces sp. NPDC093225]|uniref:hypothetical protein n=1 Tax=Streptomyces sp. NPDC093225 TaxID=3366034 RepID=UPI00382030D4
MTEQTVTEQTADGTEAPSADHADPADSAAPPRDRRVLRAVLRGTAAVAVFGAVASGVAYGIAAQERTDVPGLATLEDGRWAYPRLGKPVLPAGAPLPFAADNKDGVHYAELGALLLPGPARSRAETGLKATAEQFLAAHAPGQRAELREELTDGGLRQVAVRGWSTPDGTRTRIYLLRFPSSGFVHANRRCGLNMKLVGAEELELDSDWLQVKGSQPGFERDQGFGAGGNTPTYVYREAAPVGAEVTRAACIEAGDVQALVTMTRKGAVPMVPFHQTVVLQDQLLG